MNANHYSDGCNTNFAPGYKSEELNGQQNSGADHGWASSEMRPVTIFNPTQNPPYAITWGNVFSKLGVGPSVEKSAPNGHSNSSWREQQKWQPGIPSRGEWQQQAQSVSRSNGWAQHGRSGSPSKGWGQQQAQPSSRSNGWGQQHGQSGPSSSGWQQPSNFQYTDGAPIMQPGLPENPYLGGYEKTFHPFSPLGWWGGMPALPFPPEGGQDEEEESQSKSGEQSKKSQSGGKNKKSGKSSSGGKNGGQQHELNPGIPMTPFTSFGFEGMPISPLVDFAADIWNKNLDDNIYSALD